MGRACWRLGILLAIGALGAAESQAVPLGTTITYQGQLKQSGVAYGGTADLRLTLYDDASIGAAVAGPVTLTNVSVVAGLFTVQVDFGNGAFGADARWMLIEVRTPAGSGSYVALSPRQALTAAPNATFASNADRLDGISAESFLLGQVPIVISGSSISSGAVDVTNTLPGGTSIGVAGSTASGTGVLGHVGVGYVFTPPAGVAGTNSLASGAGVVGQASSASGSTQGGSFRSSSSSGIGVQGIATSTTGQTYGGHFSTQSSQGRAVYGDATGITGVTFGGLFQNQSAQGYAVAGLAESTSGTAHGGFFQSNSPTGIGGGFRNLNLGTAFDVEVSGPSGAINTAGFLYREYTASTPRAAIPIAYGSIGGGGAINSGTGNFTAVQAATGQYDITVNGETYSNNTFVVTITPINNSPRISCVADAGSGFRVNIWNLAGTLTDCAFQFTIWTANPNNPG